MFTYWERLLTDWLRGFSYNNKQNAKMQTEAYIVNNNGISVNV